MGELLVLLFIATLIAYSLYLSLMAIVVVYPDETLSRIQKICQVLLSILVPILGPLIVLHAASHYSTSVVYKRKLVWPINKVLFGNPNESAPRNRDDDPWDEPI